ncbi:hypothetical protein PV08_09916 [Exophiala spinifera]|uniref:Uncharacterized protein n=1 Tax=Exophiala spinifera TaxID=91928 RepID=A0A0D2B150_9EURO|nr:uncharacterized protein PV08_09916 [Exophiala spinifera]KIW12638.1 hypothetical protein PV08_09916 [Exophiala spinifera]
MHRPFALAPRDIGVKARIVMPSVSVPKKIAAAQGYGVEITFSGYTLHRRETAVSDIIHLYRIG